MWSHHGRRRGHVPWLVHELNLLEGKKEILGAVNIWQAVEESTVFFPTYRPRDSVATPLDDHFWPPTNSGHSSEQAVRIHQLVAIYQLVGLTHSRPKSGVGVVLNVGERHLEDRF